MIRTMRIWDGSTKIIRSILRNLCSGSLDVFVDGKLMNKVEVFQSGNIDLEVEVGRDDVDVVAKYIKLAGRERL